MLPRIPLRTLASRLLALSLVLCAAAACVLIAPHLERPTLSVSSIEFVGGSFIQQNFLVKFNVQNPNDRALPVSSLHADLTVLGERVASGANSRAFVVPAHGSAEFDMNITANMALVLLKLGKNRQTERIDYEMTGVASIDLPLLGNVPFHQNGSLSLQDLGLR